MNIAIVTRLIQDNDAGVWLPALPAPDLFDGMQLREADGVVEALLSGVQDEQAVYRSMTERHEWYVPPRVSRLEVKLALVEAGLFDQVDAVVGSAAPSSPLKLAWSDAVTFRRASPLIEQMRLALSVDEATVDAIFRAAIFAEL